jgi:hypothetical protein
MRDVEYARSRVQGPSIALLLVGLLDLLACLVVAALMALSILLPTQVVAMRPNPAEEIAPPIVVEGDIEATNAESESERPDRNAATQSSSATIVREASRPTPRWLITGVIIAAAVIGAWSIFGALQLLAGLKMRQLRSYGLSMTGNILALIPIHPAAIAGIPVGIYGLIVLADQRVYSAFEHLAETPIATAAKKPV